MALLVLTAFPFPRLSFKPADYMDDPCGAQQFQVVESQQITGLNDLNRLRILNLPILIMC